MYPAFLMLRSSKASSLTITVPPASRRGSSLRRAAGFMATSTLGASPGVVMSWSEMWTWKAETPASVPAGALISAGKSGNVARSFPNIALALVKRSPVSCIPSPESPAKRMMTRASRSGFGDALVRSAVSDNAVHPPVRRAIAATCCCMATLSPALALSEYGAQCTRQGSMGQVNEASEMLLTELSRSASKAASLCETLRPSVRAREKLAMTPWLRANRSLASSRV